MAPMLPVPTTAAVLPAMSKPTRPSSEKLRSRTRLCARWILRLRLSISASVCSATAFGEYAGTRTTVIPRRSAAPTSTLL